MLSRSTILILEPFPLNLDLAITALQVEGYRAVGARSLDDGVRVASEESPALVILSADSWGTQAAVSVFELARAPSTRSVPVLLLTKKPDLPVQQLPRGACITILQRPATIGDFLEAVRQRLE